MGSIGTACRARLTHARYQGLNTGSHLALVLAMSPPTVGVSRSQADAGPRPIWWSQSRRLHDMIAPDLLLLQAFHQRFWDVRLKSRGLRASLQAGSVAWDYLCSTGRHSPSGARVVTAEVQLRGSVWYVGGEPLGILATSAHAQRNTRLHTTSRLPTAPPADQADSASAQHRCRSL